MRAKRKSISSDLKRIDKLKDKAIDYSDIPELDESFFKKATVNLPKKKNLLTLRVNHKILEFFKKKGKGYQTLMNAVLRAYVEAQQHHK